MFKNGVPDKLPAESAIRTSPFRVATNRRPEASPALTRSCGAPALDGTVKNGTSVTPIEPVVIGDVNALACGTSQRERQPRTRMNNRRSRLTCFSRALEGVAELP